MGRSSGDADVIVVGGGAIGLASAWEAARRGRSVLVLERFRVGHERGSSAGLERQWRVQYSEECWSRLALDTLPLWQGLESAAGRRLVHLTGSLWFGRVGVATSEGELQAAASVLERLGVRYDWVSAAEIEARFGFARLPADHEGFHQPDGGVIDVRGTLDALHRLGAEAGVRVHENTRVRAVEPDGDGVTVRTEDGVHRAGAVIVNAGAFTNELLGPLGCPVDLRVFRMSSAYFDRRTDDVDLPTWYAFLEPGEAAGDGADGADGANGSLYGFGHNPWTGSDAVRAAPDAELRLVEPDPAVPGPPDAGHLAATAAWVGEHLPGLVPRCVRRSTCLASLPADPGRQFYLGSLAGQVQHGERVVVQSAGWAFKFVPVFGRICADLALDGHSGFHVPASALR
ncbi:FAD-dependent oxidoreductase [Streptacidiphilus sp. N1-3]|uniref:FAD-dependent oxidoreductase n=1 Tax=Streptacidiphilus alkalitolerans TaxID=3342712 RepID=A0ABV6WW06_9ACTN